MKNRDKIVRILKGEDINEDPLYDSINPLDSFKRLVNEEGSDFNKKNYGDLLQMALKEEKYSRFGSNNKRIINYLLTAYPTLFTCDDSSLLKKSNPYIDPVLLEHGVFVDQASVDAIQSHDIFNALKLLQIASDTKASVEAESPSAREVEQILLELGTAINARSAETGNTALHWAIANNKVYLVKELLAAGGIETLSIKNKASQSPIDLARALNRPYILGLCLTAEFENNSRALAMVSNKIVAVSKEIAKIQRASEGASKAQVHTEKLDSTSAAATTATKPIPTATVVTTAPKSASSTLPETTKDRKTEKEIEAQRNLGEYEKHKKGLTTLMEDTDKEIKGIVEKLKSLKNESKAENERNRITQEIEYLSDFHNKWTGENKKRAENRKKNKTPVLITGTGAEEIAGYQADVQKNREKLKLAEGRLKDTRLNDEARKEFRDEILHLKQVISSNEGFIEELKAYRDKLDKERSKAKGTDTAKPFLPEFNKTGAPGGPAFDNSGTEPSANQPKKKL